MDEDHVIFPQTQALQNCGRMLYLQSKVEQLSVRQDYVTNDSANVWFPLQLHIQC